MQEVMMRPDLGVHDGDDDDDDDDGGGGGGRKHMQEGTHDDSVE